MVPTPPHIEREASVLPTLTYVVPLRCWTPASLGSLPEYLAELPDAVEIIVVDGSEPHVFAFHATHLPARVRHIALPADAVTLNGKVGGVTTGISLARSERVIIADDDVRYEASNLAALADRLAYADVVRPQNYFSPLPWHAHWDSARTLLNRTTGGDWPGTLAVRRTSFLAAGGYRGDVLFENYELTRSIVRAGGREEVADDIYVRRLPPSSRRFFSQRVRQAYDEFARPARLSVGLAIVPMMLAVLRGRRAGWLAAAAACSVGLAETGRRRRGGARYFSPLSSLCAPLWLLERGVCSWVALARRYRDGGVRYAGQIVRRAAT